MKRPTMERIWTAVTRAVREHKLNPRWTGIGHMLDVLDDEEVLTWICVTMHQRDITRSCFIAAFFEYIEMPSIAGLARDEYAKHDTRRIKDARRDSRRSARNRRSRRVARRRATDVD